ncbi:MAG: FmdB family transcriptional regulator [Candidatus Portnoybacteria bacterium CG09_land_8_20_14_0_10_44_13]|uniref:FmdB family transcriptional regulator n=1 Tax=Candidatus Portnoybacteria bacterium CG09_land_8_20_14_0_10_44_13 TaxID=1974811 RepID=A0A2H0WU52_9BACT|nr:MAG: FmdB family transcriptional regulator [Candidatus Portnoybacteria bacterium CG09_land_8_20_14_0_10_44_13]
MPIYEFRCKKCGKKFEQLVLKKSETVSCPKCGHKKTEKLFSAFCAKSSNSKITSGHTCHSCSSGTCSNCHH